jgi:hypothetical protein
VTTPAITPLPVPPSRSDATTFASRSDAFLAALPQFQTELNGAAEAIPAAYSPLAFRNRLINGDFSIWQRGTSQTANFYGSADRWITYSQSGTTKTVTREAFPLGQAAVPGDPTYFYRIAVTSGASFENMAYLAQKIEGVRTLAGQTVRVSFYAKASAPLSVSTRFVQNFGSGGGSAGNSGGEQKFALSSSWKRYAYTATLPSISGRAIGADGNDCLEFQLYFDAGISFGPLTLSLGSQSGTFDVALVQIEPGALESSYEFRPPEVEFALCQRYYSVLTLTPTYHVVSGASALWQSYALPTQMRAAPTVSVSAALAYYSSGSSISMPVNFAYGTQTHVTVGTTTGLTNAQGIVGGGVACSCEL